MSDTDTIEPLPRQRVALSCPAFELMFGGQKGGSKSFFLLLCWGALLDAAFKRFAETRVPQKHVRIVIFRKNLRDLKDIIVKSHRVFKAMDAEADYNQNEKTWKFSSGATVEFAHLDGPEDHRGWNGQELCVTPETSILMGDGTRKFAGDVRIGETVATLEGPRRVLRTRINPPSSCVRAQILDFSGHVIGEQVQTSNHRMLMHGAWLSYDDLSRSLKNDDRARQQSNSIDGRPLQSSWSHGAPSGPDSLSRVASWSAIDAETYSAAYSSASREASRPGAHFALAMLARPEIQSHRISYAASSISARASSRFLAKSSERIAIFDAPGAELGVSLEIPPKSHAGQFLRAGDFGDICDDALSDLHIVSNFQVDYRHDFRSNDELLPAKSHTAQWPAPLRADAEVPCQSCWPWDAPGNTLLRNHSSTLSYIHPYTGQRRALSNHVSSSFAPCVLLPSDMAETVAMTIDGANHYITDSLNLINANCGLAADQVEELAHEVYAFLVAQVRTSDEYYKPYLQVRCTANPGGRHGDWVKKHFIDPHPEGNKVIKTEIINADGTKRVVTKAFIPSALKDNPYLYEDGQYEARLRASLPDHLVKMYLEGDWDAVEGAFFSSLIRPETLFFDFREQFPHGIPPTWEMKFGLDWGSTAPAAAEFGVKDNDGRIWLIGEHTKPGITGRRFGESMFQWFNLQKWSDSRKWKVEDSYGLIDHQAMGKYGSEGATAADGIASWGWRIFPANKDRYSGIEQICERLQIRADGYPGIRIARDMCPVLSRMLQTIRVNPRDAKDYDPDDHAHTVDACRFLLQDWPVLDLRTEDPRDKQVRQWEDYINKARARQNSTEHSHSYAGYE